MAQKTTFWYKDKALLEFACPGTCPNPSTLSKAGTKTSTVIGKDDLLRETQISKEWSRKPTKKEKGGKKRLPPPRRR